MTLLWGWGPLAISPAAEEVAAADRFREALKRHSEALSQGNDFELALQSRIDCAKELVRLIEKRVCELYHIEAPQGGEVTEVSPGPHFSVVEKVQEPLVKRLLATSLAQSLLSVEYELRSAQLQPAKLPTKIDGPAFWEVSGAARVTDAGYEAHDLGMSEQFDPADSNAVESEFLRAAARAYINAIQFAVGLHFFRVPDGS